MKQPTHALFIVNNWDGEGDRLWLFAYQKGDVWFAYDSDEPVIQYDGDEILKTVPLT